MLIVESMKNDLFATIVKSLSYRCQVQNNRSNSMRDMVWENTNKLVSQDPLSDSSLEEIVWVWRQVSLHPLGRALLPISKLQLSN